MSKQYISKTEKYNQNKLIQQAFIIALSLIVLAMILYEILGPDTYIGYIDGQFYYSYLPEFLIKHNFTYTVKFPIGTALCELPIFLLVHGTLSVLRPEIADGFSILYQYGVGVTGILFFVIGICFLFRSLKKLFSEKVACIASLLMGVGTFLPAYATKYASFSHIYSFAFAALFLYLLLSLDEKESKWTSFWIGIVAGMLVLLRNINAFLVLFYLLQHCLEGKQYLEHLKKIFSKERLPFHLLGGIVMLSPQLVIWKISTGHFITNAYSDEKFTYLFQPKFYEIFLSDAKGLFILSPVLIVVMVGLFLPVERRIRSLLVGSGVLFLLESYIIAAWWCYYLGGVYGERSFVDVFAFLGIPMAVFVDYVLEEKNRLMKALLIAFVVFFVLANLIFLRAAAMGQMSETFASWYELQNAWKVWH